MVVNIFGDDDNAKGKDGKPGPAGVGGLTSIIKWFPFMTLQQIRDHVNLATFKIDNKKTDVDLEQDRVTKWKAANAEKKIALIPVGEKGTIVNLGDDESHATYGLVFDNREETMYYIEKCDREYLSLDSNVMLTMTFLVGEYEPPEPLRGDNRRRPHSNSSNWPPHDMPWDGPRPAKAPRHQAQDDTRHKRQFLINDYQYSSRETSYDKLRGVSVFVKDQSFDLQLHGGFAEKDESDDFSLTIARDLEMDKFYTLQICWNKSAGSYYSLYKDSSCLENRVPFRNAPVRKTTKTALYLGGFNDSSTAAEVVKKTQLFKGVISNIEILTRWGDVVPKNLAEFISKAQIVENPPEE